MIGVVDYGLGNIQAILNIYNNLGISAVRFDRPSLSDSITHLVLPGVGTFDWAMKRLESSQLRPVLDHLVRNQNLPVLGICVGMQIMASRSSEGIQPGLGWIPGEVILLDCGTFSENRLPHMGWNDVAPKPHPLFQNIAKPRFYFLHSYCFAPSSSDFSLATTCYGHSFVSAVFRNNVFGVQFHPEKSHHWGIQLLQNFAQI